MSARHFAPSGSAFGSGASGIDISSVVNSKRSSSTETTVKVRIVGAVLLSDDPSSGTKKQLLNPSGDREIFGYEMVTLTFDRAGITVCKANRYHQPDGVQRWLDLDPVGLFGWREVRGFLLSPVQGEKDIQPTRAGKRSHVAEIPGQLSMRAPFQMAYEGMAHDGAMLEVFTVEGMFKLFLPSISYSVISSSLLVAQSLAGQHSLLADDGMLESHEVHAATLGVRDVEEVAKEASKRGALDKLTSDRRRSSIGLLRTALALLTVAIVLCAIALSLAQSAGAIHVPVVTQVNEAQVPSQAGG